MVMKKDERGGRRIPLGGVGIKDSIFLQLGLWSGYMMHALESIFRIWE